MSVATRFFRLLCNKAIPVSSTAYWWPKLQRSYSCGYRSGMTRESSGGIAINC
ncbi:hypothetical protein [Wolbachia endosymbiont (group A) of Agelastica alni]|uniref:hypothetical protein n=1 Tax=Wolbachia endosymbiont (group A) of Agelastica alni TaxID=3066130 RepID=UPI0033403FBC